MRRRLVAALVALLLLLTFQASAEWDRDADAYDIDAEFLRGDFEGVRWSRSMSTDDDRVEIIERAVIDGHDYSFTVTADGIFVDQITFIGWFDDMKMLDEGLFAKGLHAYDSCFDAVGILVPDYDGAYSIFNSYEIYNTVRSGDLSEVYCEPWRLTDVAPGFIEAEHDDGWSIFATRMVNTSGSYDGTFKLCVSRM